MMADPEQVLRDLPEESPPPEIVLAAVRVFRYRAMSAAAAIVALIAVGALLLPRFLGGAPLPERAAAARSGGYVLPVVGQGNRDGVNLLFVDTAWKDGRGYAHIVAWDRRGREISVALRSLSLGGSSVRLTTAEASASSEPGFTYVDMWAEFDAPVPPRPPARAEVVLLSGSKPLGEVTLASAPRASEGASG